ncbi:ribonuclease H-like domain-containing protein, partial [Tanacetum coccineum]
DGGVIVVEDDPDIIHFDNSYDLPLFTSLNDLDNATLIIDGQSTEVDAPPDIIDVVDQYDDITDDEDTLPFDLADSDDEDLINVDDDDGQSTEVDAPPDIIDVVDQDDYITDDKDPLPHDLADSDDDDGVDKMSADVAWGHNDDGGGDDRPPTHHIPTGYGGCFVNRGKGTRKPNLGGRKAGRMHTRQETQNLGLKKITDDKGPVTIQFEWDGKNILMPLDGHASHWSNYLGELIREMPLYYPSWQKVPAERKAAILTKIGTQFDLTPHMQSQRWTDINAGIQTYDVESIRQRRPQNITPADWDAQIAFWNDPKNQARAAQNHQNRAKSIVVCRQGSRSLARLQDQMEEMLRLQVLSSNTPSGVPYTDEEINALAQRASSGGTFPVLYESTPEFGSGSGECGDDEMADDEDDGEDEEDGDSYRCYIWLNIDLYLADNARFDVW